MKRIVKAGDGITDKLIGASVGEIAEAFKLDLDVVLIVIFEITGGAIPLFGL